MTPAGSTVQGRAQELTALGALLAGVLRGPVDPVLLLGDAGMGKSSLLDAAADLARGRRIRVVRTRSPQGGESSPFAVVADLARGLADQLALLPDGDAAVLREAPRDGSTRSGPVATALLELLAESAHAEPLLLLLDDLQWADPGSLAAVCLAVGRLQSERVAVIGAARPRPPLHSGLRAWDTVAIGPLEMDPAVRVLRAHLPESMRTMVAADQNRLGILAERLGRCPLALVEAGRLLTGDQLAGTAPLPDPMPIDEHLLTAWGAAWAGLPAPARTATLALCVTGRFGCGLLAHMLVDLGLGPDDLAAARSERLVVGESLHTLDLAHPLIRDAVLAAAGPAPARDMHGCAARAAESLGLAPSIIVAHVVASATPGDELAVARLSTLAEYARARGFGEPAGIALVAAAELELDAADRARLAARAAKVLMQGSLAKPGDERILQLAETATLPPEERFWIEWMRAERLFEQDLQQGRAAVESVAALAAEIDSPMRPWVEFSALTGAWDAQDGPSAMRHAEVLLTLAQRPDARTDTGMPAWACRAMYAATLFQVGQVRQAHEELETARSMSRSWRPRAPDALAQRLQVLVVDSQVSLPDPSVDARLEELARLLAGDPGETLGFVREGQALRASWRGNLTLARSLMDDAFALYRSSCSGSGRLYLLMGSLRIGAYEGGAALVRHQAHELRSGAARIGGLQNARIADYAEGVIALAQGRVDDALLHLAPFDQPQLLGRTPWDPVPMGRASLVEALVRAGEPQRAEDAARELEHDLGPSPDPFARGLVARALGIASDGGCAEELLLRSIAAYQEAGAPLEVARSQLLLGELHRRERRVQPARRELRAAAAAFDRAGATAWRARALGELRATRASVPPPTPDALAGLTPQERRVAEAVAAGASDRQVAAELFLSTRTVGYHLGHVYQKLGVSSRTALAARLAQAQPGLAQAGPG